MSERVHLPLVDQAAPRRRHPEWIRATLPTKPAYFELRAMVKELQQEHGATRVIVDVWCENQDHGKTMVGTASGLISR